MIVRFNDSFEWDMGAAEIYDRRGDFLYPVHEVGAYYEFTD